MGVVGAEGNLPALPGPCLDPDLLQRHGDQAGGDLLAGGHHGVVFARIVHRRQRLAPADQLVGDARHGGDHHRDLVARAHFPCDAGGDSADPVEIGHRGAAKLHHDTRHQLSVLAYARPTPFGGSVPVGRHT